MVSQGTGKSKSGKLTSERLFLGVDGGGTKTRAVLTDEKGKVLATGLSGASNPVRAGIENSVANIAAAITFACEKRNVNPSKISAATFGLAGVRRADLRLRISERIKEELKIERVEVVTDAEIALFGAVENNCGLVVIAGTGSICLGKDSNGMLHSAGGWGPLAGDEGSAARISREALRAIAKATDGRGPKTSLIKAALKYFRAGKPEDLVFAIYGPQVDNLKVAGFAKFVYETAKDGDKTAIRIMNSAGKELGLAAIAVIKKLKLTEFSFPIAKVGSVFGAEPFVPVSFMETVLKVAPNSFLIDPPLPPAEAAAKMARLSFFNNRGV